jgi:hypothetical protein
MSNVTRFPPSLNCPSCGIKLRPATGAEIRRGLQNGDAAIRQAFAYAVQGDMSSKSLESVQLPERLEDETPTGSWVLICETCGLTQVHMQEGAI